ncbi:MAG: PorT family protein [Cyclobacteriaceae bacterium]|nr:PorT family protein [Cyclobacteriaceae bacterium]
MRRPLLFLTLLFLLYSVSTSAQVTDQPSSDCEQILIQADDEFNAGRYYGIPALLKPCLDQGFSSEQKVRAYLLLTQAYLILDDPIAADDSYLKLLRADPEYVANPARDPIDVYYLSRKFISTPVFTPHLRAGFNTSLVRTIHDVSTSGNPVETKNLLRVGVQAGAGIDWNINNRWSLCGEANYSYKAFAQDKMPYFDADEGRYVERQNWFDFPLYVKFSDDSGKIRPFSYAGFAINLLFTARGVNWIYTDQKPDGSKKEATGPTEPLAFKRNLINQSLVVGGGLKYKIGKDFVYADIRYMMGLTNLTKLETNYYNEEGEFSSSVPFYNHVSDLFRLDNISISAGYIHPIYNPRKKTKPFRGIFKRKSGEKEGVE